VPIDAGHANHWGTPALLGSAIPIAEHLVNLDQLPASGFSFTAVRPKIVGADTCTVRAFASV